MKILICGLPGSGKTTLAEPLAKTLNAVWLNADQIRMKYEGRDPSKWDFSEAGRLRQADRMRYLADGAVMSGKLVVADFVCPTDATREHFKPDFTVWMDTIPFGRFDDTNKIFQKPQLKNVDYHVSSWFDNTHEVLGEALNRYSRMNNMTAIQFAVDIMEEDEKILEKLND